MIEKKAGVYNPVGVHVGPTLQVFKSLNPDKPKSCQVFKRAEKNEKLAAPPKKLPILTILAMEKINDRNEKNIAPVEENDCVSLNG